MSVDQIKELKVRIFDLQETIQSRQEFEGQFFGSLAQLLDIPQEMATDPQVYINAIVALKEKVPVEKSGEGELVE